jgi:hypothetical protein
MQKILRQTMNQLPWGERIKGNGSLNMVFQAVAEHDPYDRFALILAVQDGHYASLGEAQLRGRLDLSAKIHQISWFHALDQGHPNVHAVVRVLPRIYLDHRDGGF